MAVHSLEEGEQNRISFAAMHACTQTDVEKIEMSVNFTQASANPCDGMADDGCYY